MVSHQSNESEDLLSPEQITELRAGIEQHFKESNYHVYFTPIEKSPVRTRDFQFHLCRKLEDGGHWMSQCPIFFNLQMYAQLLQTSKFAYFLETMEEMMFGVGQYNQKLSHIIFDSIFNGKSEQWINEYKTKAMPALDYSYLVLHDDLDKMHTIAEIETYNARLKDFFLGMFGVKNIKLHQPAADTHLKDISFEFQVNQKTQNHSYGDFISMMMEKEIFHKWILNTLNDSVAGKQ